MRKGDVLKRNGVAKAVSAVSHAAAVSAQVLGHLCKLLHDIPLLIAGNFTKMQRVVAAAVFNDQGQMPVNPEVNRVLYRLACAGKSACP